MSSEERAWLQRQLRVSGRSFAGADLSSARIEKVWLVDCDLSGADLRHATLDGSHFKFCDLSAAVLCSASLRGTTFAGCDLSRADLSYADLRGARFGFVNTGAENGLSVMRGVRLAGAATEGAVFDRVVGLD